MKFIGKKQRGIASKTADAKIQILLNMFGNFILDKRGVKEKVTEEDLKEFVKLIEKK